MADASVLQCGTKLVAKSEFGVKVKTFPLRKALLFVSIPPTAKYGDGLTERDFFFFFFANWQSGRA